MDIAGSRSYPDLTGLAELVQKIRMLKSDLSRIIAQPYRPNNEVGGSNPISVFVICCCLYYPSSATSCELYLKIEYVQTANTFLKCAVLNRYHRPCFNIVVVDGFCTNLREPI
jgi:hypothetical protein